MKSRADGYLAEVLWVQLIATYLVVMGHSYPFTEAVPRWLALSQRFLYLFHMPLFVWISGYLLVYTRQSKHAAGKYLSKRFRKLLVPYIALSVLALLPKFAVQPYLNDSVTLDGYALIRTFLVPRENVWGHFWFLPMIFLFGAVGWFIDKVASACRRRRSIWAAVTLISFGIYVTCFGQSVSQWFSLKDLVAFGWLFAAGAACASFRLLDRLPAHGGLLFFIGTFIISLLLFFCKLPVALTAVKSAVIAMVMIAAFIFLSKWLAARVDINRNALYAQTFTIFLLSWPCQAVLNVLAERLLHWPYYAVMPLQFIAGIAGPMLLIWLIDKIEHKYDFHWISFFLGK